MSPTMDPDKAVTRTILVVDDNQDNRELVVKVLRNRGYQVIEAVDGEDALQKAESEIKLNDRILNRMGGELETLDDLIKWVELKNL